jgi:hypothetical protein
MLMEESTAIVTPDPGLLLARMQRAAQERLVPALDGVLRRVDDYLFDCSNRGGDGSELTALRDLRRARAPIARSFELALSDGFGRLQGAPAPARTGPAELSLVSEDALEEQLATEQLVDSLARLHAPALEVLDRRLAALLQRPSLRTGENPVGPTRLAELMRGALHTAELGTTTRIALYKFLERELSTTLTALYERMNATLVAAGILPQLQPIARVEPAPQAAPPLASPVAPDVAPTPLRQSISSAIDQAPPGPADQALYSSLLGVLQSWRQGTTTELPGRSTSGGQNLGSQEMMWVLSLMQNDPPEGLEQALGDSRVSLAGQLRRELLAGARRLGVGGEDIGLSSADEDAVDLVGMLFDVLLDERHFEPDVRRKIGRLLVPYVKVAVKDRRMFLSKGHPARRLLNAVAEACEGNQGDGPQECELLERVDGTIARLVAEFNEDLAIFETLEQELRAFMAQHRKRVELAERRAAETQSGRERLVQARADAAADLAQLRGTRQLPPVLDELVTRYGSHHLSQVGLRDGKASARYTQSLQVLGRVLVAFDHAELGTPPGQLPALDREPLQAILASSGCIGSAADDALAAIERTLAQLAAGDEAAAHAAHMPEQVVALPPPEPTPALVLVADSSKLDFDPAMAERIRGLPIGTWLQLTSESGRSEPAKVSWISPISSRLLFVNRRGIRVLVASAEELAAMAKLGTVQLREADTAFEDAMHQVIGRLQTAAVPA